ncbi:MAG: efflux RND transporter periplasmic adaptor subunit [Syntrophaceae bacterium]|nr:efflux RND transporter periplasmic adaptor subunit [Syntrophaceae bacterium]
MTRLALFGLLILFLMPVACGEGDPPPAFKPQELTGIPVTVVEETSVPDYYETSGSVMAKTITQIAARVMGMVTSLPVKEGDHVRTGQLLLTIEDQDLLQRLRAAYKSLDAAREQRDLMDITAERYAKLYTEKALTQQEMDEVTTRQKIAQSEYNRARAMTDEAKVMLGYTRITAPVSGVITAKMIDLGATAVPGMPLLTLENQDAFQVETHVDESLAEKLAAGTPVTVTIDALGLSQEGRIQKIVPSVDPRSRSFLVKIDLSAKGLRTGLFARVRIPTGQKDLLIVPQTAIVQRGQLTGVYVVDTENLTAYRLIRTGKVYNQGVEVLSGLKQGERIVKADVNRVIDGGRIK